MSIIVLLLLFLIQLFRQVLRNILPVRRQLVVSVNRLPYVAIRQELVT